jgi:hypothetical protein
MIDVDRWKFMRGVHLFGDVFIKPEPSSIKVPKIDLSPPQQTLCLSKQGLAEVYISFYKSLYPQATHNDLFDLYLMASDFICVPVPAQEETKRRISEFWDMQLDIGEISKMIDSCETFVISKDNLPFEHYYADFLAQGKQSLYFDKFISLSKTLWCGFMLFQMCVCFRAVMGGIYSAPSITGNDLCRFFPSKPKNSLIPFIKSLPFLLDERIPLYYRYEQDSESILKYLFSKYNPADLKEMWTNILSERIPEVVCEGDPVEFMSELFDLGFSWVMNNQWENFISSKRGLLWVCAYNNSPELTFRFKRSFVSYFNSHKYIERFKL